MGCSCVNDSACNVLPATAFAALIGPNSFLAKLVDFAWPKKYVIDMRIHDRSDSNEYVSLKSSLMPLINHNRLQRHSKVSLVDSRFLDANARFRLMCLSSHAKYTFSHYKER